MSKKYTQEELIELRTAAVVPTTLDFVAFTKAIEEQRAFQEQQEELEPSNRRRSSHHGIRPNFKRNAKPRQKHVAPQPDADGWVTLDHSKKNPSFGAEEGNQQKEKFKDSIKDTQVKSIRPSSRAIASGKPADARDITADKSKKAFNAFAALDSEDEDSEEKESDEE